MRFVNLDGLREYLGASLYGRWLDGHENPELALANAEARVLTAIFPREPHPDQMRLFCRAVYAQAHADWTLGRVSGLRRFSLGDYSVELDEEDKLCDAARGELLRTGLLYRGVRC